MKTEARQEPMTIVQVTFDNDCLYLRQYCCHRFSKRGDGWRYLVLKVIDREDGRWICGYRFCKTMGGAKRSAAAMKRQYAWMETKEYGVIVPIASATSGESEQG